MPVQDRTADHAADVVSGLADLTGVPLADVAEAVKGDEAAAETVRRVAPTDGAARVLVAASFNSAI
jgi:FXSXX-COOH protein